MIKLNYDGKKIRDALVEYLKGINEYKEVEMALLIEDTARHHQLFIKHQDRAEELMDNDDYTEGVKVSTIANRAYINYTNNCKTLGISAIQRKKLTLAVPEPVNENSVVNAISLMMQQQGTEMIAEVIND